MNTSTKGQRLVLASHNAGKLREIQALLANSPIEIVPQSDFAIAEASETGWTFVENAILKARHAALQSGLPAIADDSGLSVDALQGRPGVDSAYFAGPQASDRDNVAKLLAEMDRIPDDHRTAHFHCVIVLVKYARDPSPIIASGSWEGRIATYPRGTGGFGYDPVFVVDASGRTAAELETREKNDLSHRGQALRALMAQLGLKS